MNKENKKYANRCIYAAIFCFIVAGYFFLPCYTDFTKRLASKNWTETLGGITLNGIEEEYSGLRGDWNPFYQGWIEYQYSSFNKQILSGRSYITGRINNKESIAPILKDFPNGKIIPVYYNPKRVDESVIKRGITNKYISTSSFCAMMFSLFGSGFLFASLGLYLNKFKEIA